VAHGRGSTDSASPRSGFVAAVATAAIGACAALMLTTVTPVAGRQTFHDIPFEFATRQPIVRFAVNGGAPVPFVVDTGASVHVIDRGVAEKVNAASGRTRRR
jgi:hypothetical protein